MFKLKDLTCYVQFACQDCSAVIQNDYLFLLDSVYCISPIVWISHSSDVKTRLPDCQLKCGTSHKVYCYNFAQLHHIVKQVSCHKRNLCLIKLMRCYL